MRDALRDLRFSHLLPGRCQPGPVPADRLARERPPTPAAGLVPGMVLALVLMLPIVSAAAAQEGQISPPAQDLAPSQDQGLPAPGNPDLGTKGEAPLTEGEFDALTRGRTFDTYDSASGLYGVESFLSGKRVIWRDAERCMHGSWEQVGEQICFWYEDKPNDPVCWNYYDRQGWILGHYRGMVDLPAIMLYPAQGPISCQAYLGA